MGDIDSQRRRALLILLASASSLILPPKGWSQEFNVRAELNKIVGSIGTELGSPLARLGLVSFAGWFRSARIDRKPLGYEGEKRFVEGSNEVLAALYRIVPTFNPEGIPRSEPDAQLVSTFSDALTKNMSSKPSINVVFEIVRNYAEPLKSFSDAQFFHFQLMIAYVLHSTQKEMFDLASAITFIYPVC